MSTDGKGNSYVAVCARILLTGWFSFSDAEATAGDALALRRVEDVLRREAMDYDVAWSPGFRPSAVHLDDVQPTAYSYLVFVSGQLHGPQVEDLHRRFAHCVRIAVGTSVLDAADPAVTGFDCVLPRDAPAAQPLPDLAAHAPVEPMTPVVGVILAHGQQEYGDRQRLGEAAEAVTRWLADKDCACVDLEPRLDSRDWRLCATPAQFESVLARMDLVVTDRLHGLVLALRDGVPTLAVDPVAGGAKLTAQADACGWPAVVPADRLATRRLDHWWQWCLTSGRVAARQIRHEFLEESDEDSATSLVAALTQPQGSGWSAGKTHTRTR
ncbi:polysaccharide pyruvyl transferase family protein [Streptomyces sp. NPDC001634]|uniref:polysaccharide pyruvyl transferase family protein n=1 Tax=Streptomyces sp. NPDC001634 TaxID=3154390 RepID=UPI00332353A3